MTNFKEIVKETMVNGGYTNSITGNYIVAIQGFEQQIDAKEFNEKHIQDFADKNGIEFGTWLNEGIVYLDKVESFDNKEVALKEAEKRGELAIFDTKELKEISVKGGK